MVPSWLFRVGWGLGGRGPLPEEHLQGPDGGHSHLSAHQILCENCLSFIQLMCSVVSESQHGLVWPWVLREMRLEAHSQGQGPRLAFLMP